MVIQDAESRSQSLVEGVRRELQERQHEAEVFLDDARERLGSLVRDLLLRAGGRSVDDEAPEGDGSDETIAASSPLD